MVNRLAVVCNICNSVIWEGTCACNAVAVKIKKSTTNTLLIYSDNKLNDIVSGFSLVSVWETNGKVQEISTIPNIGVLHTKMSKDIVENIQR